MAPPPLPRLALALAVGTSILPAQQFARRTLSDLEGIPTDTRHFLLEDSDGDGLRDLVTVGGVSGIVLHPGRTGGGFGTGVGLPANAGSLIRATTIDLDSDGDRDLDLLIVEDSAIRRFDNDGTATFAERRGNMVPAATNAPQITSADLDLDGTDRLLLVLLAVAAPAVTLLAHRTPDSRPDPVQETVQFRPYEARWKIEGSGALHFSMHIDASTP